MLSYIGDALAPEVPKIQLRQERKCKPCKWPVWNRSMTLQQQLVFSPRPDDAGERHSHKGSFTPVFPFGSKDWGGRRCCFWRASSQSRATL